MLRAREPEFLQFSRRLPITRYVSILIVDDSAAARSQLRLMLTSGGLADAIREAGSCSGVARAGGE